MPDPSELPEDVAELVRRHFGSVAQLEALLFMREHRQAGWDVETLARRIYAAVPEVRRALHILAAEGFVAAGEQSFRYDETNEARIARLAEFYRTHLIAITNIIHSRPNALRDFSSAFRIRKDS